MLKQEHFEVMEAVKDGATIFGYVDAKRLREVQKYDDKLISIISLEELEVITNAKFDGAKQLPYFGAILTGKGKKLLKKFNSRSGQSELNKKSEAVFYCEVCERELSEDIDFCDDCLEEVGNN